MDICGKKTKYVDFILHLIGYGYKTVSIVACAAGVHLKKHAMNGTILRASAKK